MAAAASLTLTACVADPGDYYGGAQSGYDGYAPAYVEPGYVGIAPSYVQPYGYVAPSYGFGGGGGYRYRDRGYYNRPYRGDGGERFNRERVRDRGDRQEQRRQNDQPRRQQQPQQAPPGSLLDRVNRGG